jgi:transcriptional regulator of nitric oxide reductase
MRAIRSLVLAVAVAAFAAAPALAEQAGDPGTNVEMPFLIAPMTKDGKLLGYAYISTHLVATSTSAALMIRDKMAFIQDAFVRDVNAAPVSLAADPTKVDIALLGNRLVNDARRVLGDNKVAFIVFGDGKKDTGIQFSPLHPAQMPAPRPDQVAAMDAETAPAKPAAKPHE